MSKSDLWRRAPSFTEEGTFHGVVTKIEYSQYSNLARILFRKDGDPEFEPHPPESMDAELYAFLFQDEYLLTGCQKCSIYMGGSRNIAVPEDDMCVSPYHFLINFRDESPVTIRTSRSWSGKRLYVRYMKSDITGKYFGTPDETDWRQKTHPFPFLPFSGSFEINVLHIDPVMDEDDNRVYRAELTLADDDLHKPYKAYIRLSSSAGQKISDPLSAASLTGKRLTAQFTFNEESGRTALTDFSFGEEKREGEKKKKRYPNMYGDHKSIAEQYPGIPNDEFEETRGIYEAAVIEIPGIDYSRTHDFTGFLLSDGRVVVSEVRTRNAKGFTDIADSQNLIFDKKKLQPGTAVMLYFSPPRRKGGKYMILHGIAMLEE